MTGFAELLAESQVVICCGTGGVGKTTTSAATALVAATAGRRAGVVTIDPGKRLADALAIGELSNTPTVIDGPWDGTLAALMLDTESTFCEVVRRHAHADAPAARRRRRSSRSRACASCTFSVFCAYSASAMSGASGSRLVPCTKTRVPPAREPIVGVM